MILENGLKNISKNEIVAVRKSSRKNRFRGLRFYSKPISIMISFFGVIFALIGVFCVAIRTPAFVCKHKDDVEIFAARLVFPSSSFKTDFASNIKKNGNRFEDPEIPSYNGERYSDSSSEKSAHDDEEKHSNDEKVYKIIESQLGASGKKYNNFYLKKDTNLDVNIENQLTLRPDIKIKKDGSPQILIYHTHTTESYMKFDKGFYYESFYPRSTNNKFNVTQVGEMITDKLKSNKIGVIHDVTMHDNPSYNGSYSRSKKTIEKNLAENPSIQVTIDIHRDSLGGNDTGKIKPTFKVGNKKAAQIMIMSGCDENGSLEFPDWEYNLRFALRLQETAEKLYPGMTRPMYFGTVRYNMNMTHGSVLIEVGSDANTLDEAKYTGSLLGNVLSKVLSELE